MDLIALGKENMNKMQVPTSPSFLKPKPIRLKKRALRPSALPLDKVDVNSKFEADTSLTKTQRIQNPFRQNKEVKRKREFEENFDDDSNSFLWKQVNRATENSKESKSFPSPVVPSMLDESAVSAFSDTVSASFQSSTEKSHKPKAKVLPVDWSLKTKVRFASSTSFPSRGSFRTFEEVNGTIGFVRCLHSTDADSKSDVHSSHGAKFFQNCLVWMHPNLPWLNLFPRNESLNSKNNSSSVVLDSIAQEKLHSDWCDSFRSLYQLVRLYQCPYFYMCASTFTVLFRCAGAASIPVIHALITPTTKGFRKALKEEGITFTMPLYNNRESGESGFEDLLDESPSLSSSAEGISKRSDDEDEDIDPIGDDEPQSWLESLGLSQDNFPSFHKKRGDDSFYKVDHKPESLVYIEDCETQALVNFLLNSSFCNTKIGPMTGVPPTLLAPTAFLGGSLQSLKIRHGKVKTENKGEMESIEVNGPLLPNTVHSLCSLFSTTQENGFSVVLSSHTPTTAFSMVNPQSPMLPCIFAKNNLTDCGLPEPFLNQMCSKTEEFAFGNIKLEDGLFSWS